LSGFSYLDLLPGKAGGRRAMRAGITGALGAADLTAFTIHSVLPRGIIFLQSAQHPGNIWECNLITLNYFPEGSSADKVLDTLATYGNAI
jgi:hypothetical protein